MRDRKILKQDLANNHKKCNTCNITKPLVNFYFNRFQQLYVTICSECQTEKNKKAYIYTPSPNGKYHRLSPAEKKLIIKLFDNEQNIAKTAKKVNRNEYTIWSFLTRIGKHKPTKRIYTNRYEKSTKRDQLRQNKENRQYKRLVIKRDNFCCQKCGTSKGELNCHHLNGFHWDIENRFNINNGITLCKKCHIDFHVKYGKFNNTIYQYNLWNPKNKVNNKKLIKIANKHIKLIKNHNIIQNPFP